MSDRLDPALTHLSCSAAKGEGGKEGGNHHPHTAYNHAQRAHNGIYTVTLMTKCSFSSVAGVESGVSVC